MDLRYENLALMDFKFSDIITNAIYLNPHNNDCDKEEIIEKINEALNTKMLIR